MRTGSVTCAFLLCFSSMAEAGDKRSCGPGNDRGCAGALAAAADDKGKTAEPNPAEPKRCDGPSGGGLVCGPCPAGRSTEAPCAPGRCLVPRDYDRTYESPTVVPTSSLPNANGFLTVSATSTVSVATFSASYTLGTDGSKSFGISRDFGKLSFGPSLGWANGDWLPSSVCVNIGADLPAPANEKSGISGSVCYDHAIRDGTMSITISSGVGLNVPSVAGYSHTTDVTSTTTTSTLLEIFR